MATLRRARYVGSAEPNPHTIQEEAPREHEHHLDELRRPHQIREEEDEVHKVELEQAQERLEVLVAQKEVELEPCSTRGDREDEAQGLEQQKEMDEQVGELQQAWPVPAEVQQVQQGQRENEQALQHGHGEVASFRKCHQEQLPEPQGRSSARP